MTTIGQHLAECVDDLAPTQDAGEDKHSSA
jgi:hypothetical protein